MKLSFLFPTLGILLSSSALGFCDSHKDSNIVPRQSPVFSTGIQYNAEPGNEPSSGHVTIYDTLGNKRPSSSLGSESYTTSQQQGKSNFGISSFASSDSSSVYSNPYAPPPGPSNSYIPLGNRPTPGYPTAGYPDARPTVAIQPQQPKPDETYAYYYQHYPSNHQHQHYGTPSQNYGPSSGFGGLFDHDLFGGLGGGGGGEVGAAGGALGGLGALGALGIAGLAALAKGALALKPLLIFGLLILILLPLLILFLPIPIITIPTPAAPVLSGRAHQLASAVSSLTSKVLGSEECLERILCKIPPVPKKFQGHAKGLWTEYGPKVITYPRLTRGLDAYFNSTDVDTKHRAFKCNQQFKCSNKYF